MFSDPERAVRVDLPRERDPELVFFPDLPWIGFVSELDFLTAPLHRYPRDGLAERDPFAGMGLLTLDIVTLACEPHGKDVVGEES